MIADLRLGLQAVDLDAPRARAGTCHSAASTLRCCSNALVDDLLALARARGRSRPARPRTGGCGSRAALSTSPAISALTSAMKNVRVDLEAGVLAGRLLEAARLLEQQHAEAVEAGVAQRLAVLGDVRAEAARAARAGRDEHVVLDDLVRRHALRVAQVREVLHEVADGEVGRVALAAVAELLAERSASLSGTSSGVHLVAEAARAPRSRAGRAPSSGRRTRIVVCARSARVNVVRIGVDPVLDRLVGQPRRRRSAASNAFSSASMSS